MKIYISFIDRKKQSLKEGGEYEDSALLLAIAAHYNWINDIITELVQLLPALVSIDEWELASSVQSSVEHFISNALSHRHHIWPQKLHPRDLPGPLYALYTVDDVFAFPNDGGMPGVIVLGKRLWCSLLVLLNFVTKVVLRILQRLLEMEKVPVNGRCAHFYYVKKNFATGC
ncbi:unnamed protein product [Strongylus vulgaris]|uniref:ELP1 three-helical bundle domain-containing protein n=1 Tax=Strongylus vulgaris TaxID=40348 RepID=A0A3P7J7R7_STRVU|nr:unnamed protein product [Strongylus vulgaris]